GDRGRDGRVLRAVDRAGELLLAAHELGGIEVEALAGGREADDDGTAAVLRPAQGERRRVRGADRVEGDVGAVGGGLAPRRLQRLRYRGMGGAERRGLLEAALERIDADDPRGAGDPRALHTELADASRADDEHRRAGLRAPLEEDGADAGERRAAEQRGLLERHAVAER